MIIKPLVSLLILFIFIGTVGYAGYYKYINGDWVSGTTYVQTNSTITFDSASNFTQSSNTWKIYLPGDSRHTITANKSSWLGFSKTPVCNFTFTPVDLKSGKITYGAHPADSDYTCEINVDPESGPQLYVGSED